MHSDTSISSDVNSPEYWSERYRRGDTPWDLGNPTPAFAALVERIDFPKPSPTYRPQVLIPGCGYGHDALMLAQRGYVVTAVDFAPEALEYLQHNAQLLGVKLTTLCRDVFTLPEIYSAAFDVVLEYTCYCAIDPSRRQEYAHILWALTKPNGIVAGLFFPLDDVERSQPPFTVRLTDIHSEFENAGFVLIASEVPLESHPARAGREQLLIFRKPL